MLVSVKISKLEGATHPSLTNIPSELFLEEFTLGVKYSINPLLKLLLVDYHFRLILSRNYNVNLRGTKSVFNTTANEIIYTDPHGGKMVLDVDPNTTQSKLHADHDVYNVQSCLKDIVFSGFKTLGDDSTREYTKIMKCKLKFFNGDEELCLKLRLEYYVNQDEVSVVCRSNDSNILTNAILGDAEFIQKLKELYVSVLNGEQSTKKSVIRIDPVMIETTYF